MFVNLIGGYYHELLYNFVCVGTRSRLKHWYIRDFSRRGMGEGKRDGKEREKGGEN